MNTNVVISLDTRRERKDKTYPIIFRLSHDGKTLPISSGYSVPEKFWDDTYRKIRNSYKGIDNITRANNFLEKEKARFIDVLTKLKDKDELRFLSINEIKERLTALKSDETFFSYTQMIIDDMIKQKRVGNARSYSNTLREMKVFRDKKDFTFNELSYNFLKKFEAYYLAKGLSENGLAVYMRTLRAIYNRAAKDGVAEKDVYPFENYTIKTKPTKKRAIGMDAIQRIIGLEYEQGSILFETRNIFLMSFYLMGAPFVDLAYLTVNNIVDGRIQYKRQKTGKHYDIKISENLLPIIEYYKNDKSGDDYLLHIIKRGTLGDQYKDIMWARKRYNKRLKLIATDAKIGENLTSYVSRHSFASIANNMAIPLTAISEMMGHQKISTTQIYLAGLQKQVIDDYNEKIVSGK